MLLQKIYLHKPVKNSGGIGVPCRTSPSKWRKAGAILPKSIDLGVQNTTRIFCSPMKECTG